MHGDRQKLSLSMEPPQIYGGKAISNKYVFSFLRKVSTVSEDSIVIGRSYRESTFANIQLSFWNKTLFGNG